MSEIAFNRVNLFLEYCAKVQSTILDRGFVLNVDTVKIETA